ncbi:MAG: nucleotidyl transferase AbiEii/AbiGii toxin family protein [Pseudomonadota bacterium]
MDTGKLGTRRTDLINRQEIMDFSREFGLTANVIEKDYVLGWMLTGISSHSELGSSWIFKGGTCLKKCYFETYRFSEDLDFTVIKPDHLNKSFLINTFREIAAWVYETSGIEMPHELIRFEVYTNPRGKISVQGRIGYRGPLRPGGDLPRIKLDLTDDEVLVLDPAGQEVHHPYSDRPEDGIHVQCYCFEEVFAEKIRALTERLRPRDLYDVVHLYRRDNTRHDRSLILSTLENKCTFKGISLPTMDSLESKPERTELETEWENMLGHQVTVLPPFKQFWQELPELFEWLYHAIEKAVPPAIPYMGQVVDATWHPPAMAEAWHTATPLELIRFAAANRLCVNLNYIDTNGNTKRPIIEPYSMRLTRDGNLLLYAVKHDTTEARSYRVDRIQGAEVTKIPFTPRYAVELTALGPVYAPKTKVRTSKTGITRLQSTKSTISRSRSRTPGYDPKYVFKCTVCGKQFIHKSYDSSLNQHNNKQGYPCPGRTGVYITTKY